MVGSGGTQPILGTFTTGAQVQEYIRQNDIGIVDLRFVDLLGTVQHFSIPSAELNDSIFEWGDRVRRFEHPWIPDDRRKRHAHRPRSKVRLYGPDAEAQDDGDHVRHSRSDDGGVVHQGPAVRGPEGGGIPANDGHRGHLVLGPGDRVLHLRQRAVRLHGELGIPLHRLERGDLELGTGRRQPGVPAQAQGGVFPAAARGFTTGPPVGHHPGDDVGWVAYRQTPTTKSQRQGRARSACTTTTLVAQADAVQTYKYLLRQVVHKNGKVATFMPKPLFGDNGTGMHTHQSLWKDGATLFYDENGYAESSEMMLYYVGGLLRHAPAILGFAAPTTNSYKRLVPGFEAPTNLAYSRRNRSAAARIPMYEMGQPETKRIEFRCPDPTANAYLAFRSYADGWAGRDPKPDPPWRAVRHGHL